MNEIPSRYRRHDHTWVLTVWVLPLALAAALTAVSGGLLAITLPVALVVSVIATVLRRRD
jgi:hypothetical protein